ncbi:sugar phosphate isomerase/epimerase family protein [Castellaniella sp. GW247-6E4]|uniref:sugar phosphate isomerase/epimerase family protein n=1 Tax=Castellaniella sp. GW247-6E4 TaxID=3140380 RepID=UPI0033152126
MNVPQASINTYGYIWSHPLKSCLEQLAPQGYRQFEGVINPPHLDPESPPAQRRALRDYMAGEGLSFTSLNLPSLDTNLASPFAAARDYTISLFKKALTLAADLGAPRLVTVPGRVNPLLPCPPTQAITFVQDTVGALIPFARDLGVGLAIENVPFAALPRSLDIRQFLDDMGNEDVLCACYDVANAHFIGEPPQAGIDSLGDRIRLVHCSDTTRGAWRHDPVGKGDVPFEQLGAVLQAQGYGGPILLEIIDRDPLSSILHSHDSLAEHGLVAHRKP